VFLLNWEHTLGQWALYAQYAWADEVEGLTGANTGGTKIQAYMAAAKYFLSKRTGVYVSYNKIKNEANAFGDFGGAGMSSAAGNLLSATNGEGADPQIIAIGIMHNF
jgi:predicted porin